MLTVLITDAIPYNCDYTEKCENIWVIWPYVRYVWLLTPLSHMCSVWFVVLVGLNRYWAVCRPYALSTIWALRRTVGYIVCIVVCVVTFNAPRFFEYGIETYADVTYENVTVCRNVPLCFSNSECFVNDAVDVQQISASYEIETNASSFKQFPTNEVVCNNSSHKIWKELLENSIGFLRPCTGSNDSAIVNNQTLHKLYQLGRNIFHETFCEIENRTITEYSNREYVTDFGMSDVYHVVYKSFLVVIVLIMCPLIMLSCLTFRVLYVLRLHMKKKSRMIKRSEILRQQSSEGVESKTKRSDTQHHQRGTFHLETMEHTTDCPETCMTSVNSVTNMDTKKRQIPMNIKRKTIATPSNSGNDVTILLILVVAVAVSTNTPLCVFHLIRLLDIYECGDSVFYLDNISKLLININSCLNFVLYCCFCRRFRNIIGRQIFGKCFPKTFFKICSFK